MASPLITNIYLLDLVVTLNGIFEDGNNVQLQKAELVTRTKLKKHGNCVANNGPEKGITEVGDRRSWSHGRNS